MKILSVEQLEQFRQDCIDEVKNRKMLISVCGGTGCMASGSANLFQKFKDELSKRNITFSFGDESGEEHGQEEIHLDISGCHGFCEMGPLVKILPLDILYVQVKAEDIEEIVEQTIMQEKVIERLLYHNPATGEASKGEHDIPFYKKQTRTVLAKCGNINPANVKDYIRHDGYKALGMVTKMEQKEICDIITDSNLRGRGGAGFVTGKKWALVQRQTEPIKYVVCNGDEGDPGAFMDRSIMEGDPHAVLEGLLVAGFATGAHQGYIYVRAEYPLAVRRLQLAIKQAEEYGFLGENILGSGFDFHIQINKGAGAFVCGEGSALTASIEGNRGMPRTKPPRTGEKGLWEKPTVLNNVETLANVPQIIAKGAAWFKSIGTENNSGTKAFALTGNINNTGLIEVPLGITLREIIYDIGGGIPGGKKFKAVQVGGPSGGCLCFMDSHLDLKMDFDSLKRVGAMIGSGGLVVMDEDTCIVEVARFFMNFTQKESCGKCIPCREGTKRMLEILEKIVAGRGTLEDLDLLEELAITVKTGSLCGLGQTAANPVLSTLQFFRDEYLAHVVDKKCPTGVCKNLTNYEIDPEKCRGCSKCARNCPANAISGKIKEPFVIDQSKCIKCGSCVTTCPFGAVKGA